MKNKIFGIGLSRTGTTSCCKLINSIGISSIHLPNSFSDIDSHTFANDTSVSARLVELDKKYPNSKFIYTIRDLEQWIESCVSWLQLPTRNAWFASLPTNDARKWISDGDYALYGKSFFDLPKITRAELKDAYEKHDEMVRNFFYDRPKDILTIDLTNKNNFPVSQIVHFLEINDYVQMPLVNVKIK